MDSPLNKFRFLIFNHSAIHISIIKLFQSIISSKTINKFKKSKNNNLKVKKKTILKNWKIQNLEKTNEKNILFIFFYGFFMYQLSFKLI